MHDRRSVVLTIMCVGMFLVLLDVTVVNVALPSIGSGLQTDVTGLQWVVDGYSVALAALLLAGGRLGDVRGHKRVVLAGLGLFGMASLGCGAAVSTEMLVAFRAIQGVGAALLLPGTVAVIARAYPNRAEQARALGIWAGVSSLALPAGPLLAGLLVSTAGWRSVFLINLPVVAAAFVATVRVVSESRAEAARRLDVAGTAAAALCLAAAVFCVINAGREGVSGLTLASAVTALAAAATFVFVEHRTSDPTLPLGLLRSAGFVGANAVAAAMNTVGIGTIFVLTLYLQSVQHHSAVLAGAQLVPLFLPLAALSPVTGRLVARFGPRPLMLAGLLVGAAGAATLLFVGADSSYVRLLPALVGLGVGMGLLTAAVVAAAMRAVPAERAGLASGVNNTARQAAGAFGIAIFGAVAGTPDEPGRFVQGLHHLAVASAGLRLMAALITYVAIPGRGPMPSEG
jgi:DHA2 family methylenomycin A resistance protein-like MFS transporter